MRLASVAHAKTSTAPVARTTRSGVSHASGAGRRGPASERVRGLGTKSPDQERAATVFRPAEAGRGRPVPARPAHGSGESFGRLDRSLRSPGQQFAPAQLPRTGKNAPSALPLATRAGSPTQRGHHAAGAFYLIEPRPLTLTGANRCPGSRADLGSQVEGSGRCPPGPCRCWAAAPVWSTPRAAESRFVTYHRSAPKQENRRGPGMAQSALFG